MGQVTSIDNNEFLPDGVTPNPNYGHVTVTGTPDPIVPDFTAARETHRAFVRSRATQLFKTNQTGAGLALLATIGE